MHPATDTPTPAVYWTHQADETFYKSICDYVLCPPDDVGAQIVMGTHANRVEEIARARWATAPRVTRQVVEDYFRQIKQGEAK